jgi:hypothetical protein
VELTLEDAELELDWEVAEEVAALLEPVLEPVAADVLDVGGEEEAELAEGGVGEEGVLAEGLAEDGLRMPGKAAGFLGFLLSLALKMPWPERLCAVMRMERRDERESGTERT